METRNKMYTESIVNVFEIRMGSFKKSYYFDDLFLLSMYELPSDILTQYENTKVTLSFLSPQHHFSINKEKFYRDLRKKECMIFYVKLFLFLLILSITTEL